MNGWICPACGSKNRETMTICRFCRFDDSVDVARYGAITRLNEKEKQQLLARVEEGTLIKMMKSFEKELKAVKEELNELKTAKEAKKEKEEAGELKAIKEELSLLEYEKGKNSASKEAEQWYRKAAEHGNVDAMVGLVECNAAEIKMEWYKKAAERGSKKAQKYVTEYNAIEKNDAKAQREIGDYYYEKGTMSDFAKAVQWYEKAAEQGDTEAQIKMGDCCFFGYGIKRNQEKAIEWYEKAAKKGDVNAKERLSVYCKKIGDFYYSGQGRPKDWEKAKEWYKKAVEQGNEKAKERLVLLCQF